MAKTRDVWLITAIGVFCSTFFCSDIQGQYYVDFVIDPGHGGVDPGNVTNVPEFNESDINLLVAMALEDSMECYPLYTYRFTRLWDTNIYRYDRINIANELWASQFVSIHHNAATDCSNSSSTQQGSEAFYWNGYLTTGCPPPWNNQHRWYDDSLALKLLLRTYEVFKYKNRGVQSEDFDVLRCASAPVVSALTEASFVCSTKFTPEAYRFYHDSADHVGKEASALMQGMISYAEGQGIAIVEYAYEGQAGGDNPYVYIDWEQQTAPYKACWRTMESHFLRAQAFEHLIEQSGEAAGVAAYPYTFHHWEHLDWLTQMSFESPAYYPDWYITV